MTNALEKLNHEVKTNLIGTGRRFSKARFEACMISSDTSYKQLNAALDFDVEPLVVSGDMPYDILVKACNVMQCDPEYVYMINDDPKVGKIMVKQPKVIPIKIKGSEIEINTLDKFITLDAFHKTGMSESVFLNMIGITGNYSVDQVLSQNKFREGTINRISWLLGLDIGYLQGTKIGKHLEPISSTIPENCDFAFDGTKLDRAEFMKKPCGFSKELIGWLCAGTRRIPKALATKIAESTGNKCWKYKGNASDNDVDAPIAQYLFGAHIPSIRRETIIQLYFQNTSNVATVVDKYRAKILHESDMAAFTNDLSVFTEVTYDEIERGMATFIVNTALRVCGMKLRILPIDNDKNRSVIVAATPSEAKKYFKSLRKYETASRITPSDMAEVEGYTSNFKGPKPATTKTVVKETVENTTAPVRSNNKATTYDVREAMEVIDHITDDEIELLEIYIMYSKKLRALKRGDTNVR